MRTKIGSLLILAVVAVFLASFGFYFLFLIHSQQEALIDEIKRHASELSETIKSSTRYAMLLNRREDVHQIIDTIGEQPCIENVRIFNKMGEITYSPDKDAIGSMVDKRAEACFACHAADSPLQRLPSTERSRIYSGPDGCRDLGVINPIYNEPSCWQAQCHAHTAEQTVLGVLDVSVCLDEADAQIAALRWRTASWTGAAILATSLILWLLFSRLVGQPVRRLLRATNAVATGDLGHQIEVQRNDELGQLAQSFNEMTQKLSEAQKQIYQSNKLASVGRLAAGVAHEINNPLTAVLTFSSLLVKNPELDDESKEDLETIVRETKRCRDIVRGLLDFSRQMPPQQSEVKINEVVDHSITIVDNQLNMAQVSVTKTLREDLPTFRGDANQLVQVMINLLVNAADAIGSHGGQVFVSTDLKEIDGENAIEIKVADSGCGIPEDHLEKLFEPFFTTKENKGTGLGLAVVWGIVEEHGGTISVDSKPDRGATFTIRLPLQRRDKATNSKEPNAN